MIGILRHMQEHVLAHVHACFRFALTSALLAQERSVSTVKVVYIDTGVRFLRCRIVSTTDAIAASQPQCSPLVSG